MHWNWSLLPSLLLKELENSGEKKHVESNSVTNKPLINHKSSVLFLFWSTLFIIHNSLVLITVPNAQRAEPEEINRQHSPNSSSSPPELTQIGEISLWSCLLNNKQNTNLISLIQNRSKCLCLLWKPSFWVLLLKIKLSWTSVRVLPLVDLLMHAVCVCVCGVWGLSVNLILIPKCARRPLTPLLSESTKTLTGFSACVRKKRKASLLQID